MEENSACRYSLVRGEQATHSLTRSLWLIEMHVGPIFSLVGPTCVSINDSVLERVLRGCVVSISPIGKFYYLTSFFDVCLNVWWKVLGWNLVSLHQFIKQCFQCVGSQGVEAWSWLGWRDEKSTSFEPFEKLSQQMEGSGCPTGSSTYSQNCWSFPYWTNRQEWMWYNRC